MGFRRLTIVAMLASLLGFAASRLGGPHLPGMLAWLGRARGPVAAVRVLAIEDGGVALDAGPRAAAEPALAATPLPQRDERSPPGRARRPGAGLEAELARGVRKLGERRYEIRRAALVLALRNLRALSAWVRVAPHVHDGKAAGFRVLSVAASGPFAKLGLRRDDVLVSVNGLDVRAPDRALDAYAKLKSASRFALGVVRDGRELELTYQVR